MPDLTLEDLNNKLNSVLEFMRRGGVDVKEIKEPKKRGRPQNPNKADPTTKQQVALLKLIADHGEPLPAEALAHLAIKAGYQKGNGASGMFKGNNPSLEYIVTKYVVLTKRGQQLLSSHVKEPIKEANGKTALEKVKE